MEMKVIHIYHSGFYIELAQCAMLFDYYEGELPPIRTDMPLYVFASHVHQDHFSFSVFTKEELRAHPHVFYILSNDIKRKYNRNFFLRQGVADGQYERITFMKAGEKVCVGKGNDPDGQELPEMCIRTLRSTDAGVAFVVEAGERRIFHAGDLNWWSWEGESEEDARSMECAYKGEIEKIAGERMDLACLPLDSRQGEKFALGFDFFMRHVETAHAYPMHYWDDEAVVDRLWSLPCSEPYRDRIVRGAELLL